MKKRENPVIQRVSDPFDDLVMDSNKSLKSIYKGSRRNGVRMAKRKKGMTFIPYDYEAAYNVDGGTPKSTDLLLVKGGTPFTTDYDKYIAGTSHTI